MTRNQPQVRETPKAPSGHLVAALVLLLVAPPAILGWMAGAVVVRSGWASRGRLAAAGGVTGALALLATGPAVVAGRLLGTAAALGGVLPASLTAGTVLEAVGAIVVRGLGLAWVTVPAGILIATVPPRPGLAVPPEWAEQERRARARAEARTRRRAERLSTSPRVVASDALGVALNPDIQLPSWRRRSLIVPPADHFGLTTLLLGGPGTGKTTTSERITELAAKERRHLTVIDGKGTDGLAEQLAAVVLSAWPDARIRSFPDDPVDLWRGTPQQLANRLVAAWRFTEEAEFYEQAAMLGLRLALTAPGPPVWSTSELVTRLDPAWLERAWQGNPGALSLLRGPMKTRLGDVALRASNLEASLGPAWDGSWWLDDVDVALFTLPTLDNVKDSDACMRVLLAAYGQHLTRRADRRPSLLLFDEFSSLQGGRPLAINLVERSRSAGSGVLLSAQSVAGLGDETDRERLIASANAVILFRSPMPAELAQLAGSERVPEAAWQLDGDDLTGRQTITLRARSRIDADRVRSAPTGVAEIIANGRVERAKIIRPAVPDAARERARGLTRPRPAGIAAGNPAPSDEPAGAVAEREVPGPVPARQGQAPAGSPSASLDRPGPGRVRRHRPPGSGGEAAPPVDRAGLVLEGSEGVTPNETP